MKNKQVSRRSDKYRAVIAESRHKVEIDDPSAGDLLRRLIVSVQLPGFEQQQLDIKLAGKMDKLA